MEDETSRSRLLRLVFLLTFFAAAMRPAPALADGQPKVVRFSPRGTVKQVRQVTARCAHRAARTSALVVKKSRATAPMLMYQVSRSGELRSGR